MTDGVTKEANNNQLSDSGLSEKACILANP